jgi:hypothetical protein
MQFSLQTLMLAFVVVAAAVGLCGLWGILFAAVLLAAAGYIRMARDRGKAWQIVAMASLIVLSVGGFVIGFTYRTDTYYNRDQCINRERQIVQALFAYEADKGHLPPAFIADAAGKPMHSWRVLILPYLERKDLYDAYDFNEPWNGPHNSKLAMNARSPFVYSGNDYASHTNYFAVIGSGTMWPGAKTRSRKDLAAIEGSDQTILLVERAVSDVNWLEPRDLSFDEVCEMTPKKNPEFFSPHGQGTVVSLADGTQRVLPPGFLAGNIRDLLMPEQAGKVELDNVSAFPTENERRWQFRKGMASVLILVAATAVIIYRPLPKTAEKEEEQEEEIRLEDTSEPAVETGKDNQSSNESERTL